MKLKRILKTVLLSSLVLCCGLSLACCDSDSDKIVRPEPNPALKKDTENKVGYQLEMPEKGDTIAIIHTTMGDITWRFFPENAPKAVESFTTLAKEGKYDGIIFHRVIDNFMIQGGDYENQNGTGGKSAFGTPFEDEFSDTLYNIRGSVAMANSGVNTNGSQFFINQAGPDKFSADMIQDYDTAYKALLDDYNKAVEQDPSVKKNYPTLQDYIKTYTEYYGNHPISLLSYLFTDEVKALYEANGGNIHLDGALRAKGGHTVFAQVIDGMDVVDAIAKVKVDANDKPVEDVKIISVEITEYKG